MSNLIELQCANCGITFAMEKAWNDRLRENHKGFHCPSGHSNVYSGTTEEDKLKEKIKEKERLLIEKDREINRLKFPLKKRRGRPLKN